MNRLSFNKIALAALLLALALPLADARAFYTDVQPCGDDYNGDFGCTGGGGYYPTPTPSPTPIPLNDSIYYDANGNRVLAGGLSYEYNGFNQLARVRNVTAGGIAIEEYVYDQDGNRLMKFEPQINQTTYYVNDNYVEVVNSSGTYPTIYYYENGVLVGRREKTGAKFYYHPDHLGSTTLVTNQTGGAVENTAYEPFGAQLEGGSPASGKFTYTGKEQDQGTGLYYYGARYYDARLGQFAQPDQTIPNIYYPQALNRYAYVYNNPYKFTDPDGKLPWLVIMAAPFIAEAASDIVLTLIDLYQKADSDTLKTDAMMIALPGVPIIMTRIGSTQTVREAKTVIKCEIRGLAMPPRYPLCARRLLPAFLLGQAGLLRRLAELN